MLLKDAEVTRATFDYAEGHVFITSLEFAKLVKEATAATIVAPLSHPGKVVMDVDGDTVPVDSPAPAAYRRLFPNGMPGFSSPKG